MSFRDYIFEKNVLLLGPASYLYDGSFNEDLDNYDVVVKINRMVETELCKNFINDRCDVLYHCIDIAPKYGMFQYDLEFIKKRVKQIRIPYPAVIPYYNNNIRNFLYFNREIDMPYSIVEQQVYVDLHQKCSNTSPNTGTIIIYDLLQQNPKSLTIKGITMFDGGYEHKYRSKVTTEEEVESINSKVGNHNTNNQTHIFRL
jgi:hypothetical protein